MAHAHVRSEAAWKWLRIADLHGGRRRSRVRGPQPPDRRHETVPLPR